ncbi:anti-sigma factor domain-containing protein [Psychrobacillus sp. OK032]|uniref:anti-sigma factor domain-containing protein n=1 Tax=Psychrobacillus sp. OK032 TaxID=1884358 RepID=UPI0015A5E88F|nr:anti-sigma factor domain-containing protein [Psychrobacillus sp. OK032]
MRTYKGIVCEKKNEYMVFLTKEGEFLRGTPIGPTPEVGEEVEFHLVAVPKLLRKRMKPLFVGPAIVAAVLLLFVVASLIPQTSNAYAYVQLEGETTVELGVDEEGNVVSLRSLDESTLFELDEWEGLPLNIVLAEAMNQLQSTNEDIDITTVYEKEDQEELKKRIDQAVNEVQKQPKNNTENTKPIQKETPPAVEHKPKEKEPVINTHKEQPKPDNDPNINQNKEKQREIKHQEKQQKQLDKQHEKQQKEQEKLEKKKEKEEEKAQAKQEKEEEKAKKQLEKNERKNKDNDDEQEEEENNDDE